MTHSAKCPRDSSILKSTTYQSNLKVDVCNECDGMWLDQGELEAIEAGTRSGYVAHLEGMRDSVAASIEMSAQLARVPGACPRCGAVMAASEYAYCSQIVVDRCPDGCGVWLDAREIDAIEDFFSRAQVAAADAIPFTWQLWASVRRLISPKENAR